ncbi:MAG: hypothetical protein HN576_11525 [Bacteriovoracaceae bacterium]|nr:hypothetical protein [Bacteriovoracaceae bacterium]
MKTLALTFIIIILSCSNVQSAFSYKPKNKHITNLLEGKNLEHVFRYKNIAIYSSKDSTHVLIYVWREEVLIKEFNYNPCRLIAEEKIQLTGLGFSIFQNAIERALILNADAIEVAEDFKDKTKIFFLNCTLKSKY